MATYSQSATWKNSSDAIDRITCAVLIYARFIIGEASSVALHSVRANWAKGAFQNPGGTASGLLSAVALDPNITANLPTTPTDAVLQAATESAINTILNF